MAQIIADVMTRDPSVERQESASATARRIPAAEEDSGSALADVSAAEGNT